MPQEHLVGSIPSQPSPSSQRSASLSHGSQTELAWLAESKTSGRVQLSLHLKDPTDSLPTSIPTSHKEDRWVGFHRQPLPSRTDGWLPTVMVMRTPKKPYSNYFLFPDRLPIFPHHRPSSVDFFSFHVSRLFCGSPAPYLQRGTDDLFLGRLPMFLILWTGRILFSTKS